MTFATLGEYELYCITTWAATGLSVAFDAPLEFVDKELERQLASSKLVVVDEEKYVEKEVVEDWRKVTDEELELVIDVEDDKEREDDRTVLVIELVGVALPEDWLVIVVVTLLLARLSVRYDMEAITMSTTIIDTISESRTAALFRVIKHYH